MVALSLLTKARFKLEEKTENQPRMEIEGKFEAKKINDLESEAQPKFEAELQRKSNNIMIDEPVVPTMPASFYVFILLIQARLLDTVV